jgi:hypothetical protein
MRIVFGLALAVVVGGASQALSQPEAAPTSPKFVLELPPNVPSETVQINYFMIGPFGGYGMFVQSQRGKTRYEMAAAVDGKPAESIKVIAFLPGCEISTLTIIMRSSSEARTVSCKPLGAIPLRGRITPFSGVQLAGTTVTVDYLADWDHAFFGIADGMVTSFRLATVVPDDDGNFTVEIPDYARQANLGKGHLQFILRNAEDQNILAFLKPTNMPASFNGLAVLGSYEPFVQFGAEPVSRTPALIVPQPH